VCEYMCVFRCFWVCLCVCVLEREDLFVCVCVSIKTRFDENIAIIIFIYFLKSWTWIVHILENQVGASHLLFIFQNYFCFLHFFAFWELRNDVNVTFLGTITLIQLH
jgi:hypothetical protein